MIRYIIQSKRTLLYVKNFDNYWLKMTSNQSEAFKYCSPTKKLARLELYKSELDTTMYRVVPFKGV